MAYDRQHHVRSEKLGMNLVTARRRLERDLMFKMLEDSGKNQCFRCGKPMERDNFTIEHKESWLRADDPKAKFFDLGNIAYSHNLCNSNSNVKPERVHGSASSYKKGCRCEVCKVGQSSRRRVRYERTGA